MHLLVCIDPKDAPHDVTEFDKYVSGRIPDPEKEPRLYHLVTKFHLHRMCGNFSMGRQYRDSSQTVVSESLSIPRTHSVDSGRMLSS